MTQQYSCTQCKLDRVMTQEQFSQVVEAILEGKYSWACVLILQFAGYNPLHYIPYRTYNRLTKDNYKAGHRNRHFSNRVNSEQQPCGFAAYSPSLKEQTSSKIDDLNYLEVVGISQTQVQGGNTGGLDQWLNSKLRSQRSLDYGLSWWN